MTTRLLALLPLLLHGVLSFAPSASNPRAFRATASRGEFVCRMADTAEVADVVDSTTEAVSVDPKEAVKLFGRLAEKYIMLDASGGMCCYSACSDCEFRNPDGGYIMADQSASRPKWIPAYDHRAFESGKEHTSKWSSEIFKDGPAVTKEQFVAAVTAMSFATPLGGPFVSASAGKAMDDPAAAEALFDVIAGEKEKLTRHRMGVRMKELAGGEEGWTWPAFSRALGVA